MCGIAGLWNYHSGKPVNEAELTAMCDAIAHRGPDDFGLFLVKDLGLGHRRLSILDIGGGHQPWHVQESKICVVFNGEIYNYKDLRSELEKDGFVFKSTCDTEVIPYCYIKYGDCFVEHIEGMFAIVLWDANKRELFLARDRLGKKPLLYAKTYEGLAFSSEMQSILCVKALTPELSYAAVDSYLSLGFIPNSQCIFNNVQKVKPATVIKITDRGDFSEKCYWQLSKRNNRSKNYNEVKIEFREILKAAVARRLYADVPIGAFLSGGIDSSVVTALMSKESTGNINTFCVGFLKNSFDERNSSRAVANYLSTQHRDFIVDVDAAGILPKLMRHFGEPYADASAIPTYYLCKAVKEHVTVALSGDGGDELFLGYNAYRRLYNRYLLGFLTQRQPIRYFLNVAAARYPRMKGSRILSYFNTVTESSLPLATQFELIRAPFGKSEKYDIYEPAINKIIAGRDFSEERIEELLKQKTNNNILQKASLVDIALYLPDDILIKVDIASMACGLEVRSPLLDRRIVEFCVNLPVQMKYNRGSGKYLLKELAYELLPKEIMMRPKQGFGVPIADWLRGDLEILSNQALLDASKYFYRIFKRSKIEQILQLHQKGIKDNSGKIWALMCFSLWLDGVGKSIKIKEI